MQSGWRGRARRLDGADRWARACATRTLFWLAADACDSPMCTDQPDRTRRQPPGGTVVTTRLTIPKPAVTMSEGSITEWLVSDGEEVRAGQPLYTLETEKTETEIEAPTDGTVRIVGEPGVAYEVGTVIGSIE